MIIGLVGMPGAGKGEVVKALASHGFTSLSGGDIVREECRRRDLELSATNQTYVSLKLREEEGSNVLCERLKSHIDECVEKGLSVAVDGIRTVEEHEFFKTHYPNNYFLVCVDAPTEIRHQRLLKRGQQDKDRLVTLEDIKARDSEEWRDKRIADLIACAEKTIDNCFDGEIGMERLEGQVKALVDNLSATLV